MGSQFKGRGGGFSSGWTDINNENILPFISNSDKASLNGDRALDNWDPMAEDYKHSGTSDNRNYGSRNRKDIFILYMKGVPLEMTREGVKEFIRTTCNVAPLDANVKESQMEEFNSKIAFIDIETKEACDLIIKTLSGYKIGKNVINVSMKRDSKSKDKGEQPPQQGSSPREDAPNRCTVCNRPSYQTCSLCNNAYYCTVHCQTEDWPQHRERCNRARGVETSHKRSKSLGRRARTPSGRGKRNSSPGNRSLRGKSPETRGRSRPGSPRGDYPLIYLDDLPKILLPPRAKVMYVQGRSPLAFYVQLCDCSTTTQNIYRELQKQESLRPIDGRPKDDSLVVAKCENGWSRCIVLSSGNRKIRVRCLDTALEDAVELENIRPMRCLSNVMPQAIPCRLNNALVPDEHREIVISFFEDTMAKYGCQMKLKRVSQGPDGVYSVDVQLENGIDLLQWLIQHGHARSGTNGIQERPLSSGVGNKVMKRRLIKYNPNHAEITLGRVYPMRLSWFESINDMYVNLETKDMLEATSPGGFLSTYNGEELPTFAQLDQVPQVNHLVLCYNEDYKEWYRGVITRVIDTDRSEVFSVDYGEKRLLGCGVLRPALFEHLECPPLAYKCTIQDPDVKPILMQLQNIPRVTCQKIMMDIIGNDYKVKAKVVEYEGINLQVQLQGMSFSKLLRMKMKKYATEDQLTGRSAIPNALEERISRIEESLELAARERAEIAVKTSEMLRILQRLEKNFSLH